MKHKKLIAGMLAVFLGGWLCGCSLAVPGAEEEKEEDRLIGVFITGETLDLFDMEGYLEDHAGEIFKKDQITINDTSGYEKVLHATIDKSGGENAFDWNVVFEGVSGTRFFMPFMTDGDGESGWANMSDDGVSDVQLHVKQTDDGEELEISGTFYVLPEKTDENFAYFVNPVYQTAEGDIYATAGQGVSTGGDVSEGIKMSTELENEVTITENGTPQTQKSQVSISFGIMYEPVKITVYQMNNDHQVISEQEYKPGTLPETLQPETDAAYLVAEIHKKTAAGEESVSRQIYNRTDESEACRMETFYALENGFVAKQDTELVWE